MISQRNSANALVWRFSAFKVVFLLFTSHYYVLLGHTADEELGLGTVSNLPNVTKVGNGKAGLKQDLGMPLSVLPRLQDKKSEM